METSPDTENMVFFPKEFLESIKQAAGNSLQDETKIQGFYPIIGKQGRDSIKLLNDGETVPTVIQKISSSEKEKLQEFLKEQEITADWETLHTRKRNNYYSMITEYQNMQKSRH